MKLNSWDFTEADTTEVTHGFHTYPAKMIPQVAEKLIKEYGRKNSLLFDPYCGTGTSLVEANINGLDAIGTDLNPLARLIAKAKTTIIELQTLDLYLKDYFNFLFQHIFGFKQNDSVVAPQFSNIDFWFSKSIKNDLAVLKNYIDQIEDETVGNFFKVAFSQTIRECSWTRKNEFKLYKMDKDKIKNFKPDTFRTFEKILANNRKGLASLIEKKKNKKFSLVYDFNTTLNIPESAIDDGAINLIVTSPPYGDSQTTVAYGQFSRLTNEWLGYKDPQKLDSKLMGGKKYDAILNFDSKLLNKQIKQIEAVDRKRALEVFTFYKDFHDSIVNVSKKIKKGGHACYVVSNRCVRGVTLKTDVFTKDFFIENRFSHVGTFERKISSKRMPRKNSPSGTRGDTTSLMNKEYIVVMQKS